jgi:hypothetical protein
VSAIDTTLGRSERIALADNVPALGAPPEGDLEPGRRLRRVQFAGDSGSRSIAAQHGCHPSAIVQLVPFILDGALVLVAASADRHLSAADLLRCLKAASIRGLTPGEVATAFRLGTPRARVYLDRALLGHPELLLCAEPPLGYVVGKPAAVQRLLAAEPISLP